MIVCDGFVGNILLKFAETIYELLVGRLKGQDSPDACEGLDEVMSTFRRDFDYAEQGGVPLLGLNGVSMICHGRSSARAIKNAIREAVVMKQQDIPNAIKEGIERYHAGVFSRGFARLHSFQERREHFSSDID